MYFGFDLFEDGTIDDDIREFNAKPRQPISYVEGRLKGKFGFKLYKGDSRTTLTQFLSEHGERSVDFAYIDGGHSVETIRSDWSNVKKALRPGGMAIFDDFYTDMSPQRLEEVGCNKVVEDLDYQVLPQKDPVVGGGWVQLVFIRSE